MSSELVGRRKSGDEEEGDEEEEVDNQACQAGAGRPL